MTLLRPRSFTELDYNTIRCLTGIQRYEVMQSCTESTLLYFVHQKSKQMISHVHVPRKLSNLLF